MTPRKTELPPIKTNILSRGASSSAVMSLTGLFRRIGQSPIYRHAALKRERSLASVADRLAGFDVRHQTVAKPKYDELERRYGL